MKQLNILNGREKFAKNGPNYTPDKYILDAEGNPVPCYDLMEWGRFLGSEEKRIGYDKVNGLRISTMFFGCDLGGATNPVFWETMIFSKEHNFVYNRYATKQEAIEGHAKAVEMTKSGNFEDE